MPSSAYSRCASVKAADKASTAAAPRLDKAVGQPPDSDGMDKAGCGTPTAAAMVPKPDMDADMEPLEFYWMAPVSSAGLPKARAMLESASGAPCPSSG